MSAGIMDWSSRDRQFRKSFQRAMIISAAAHVVFLTTALVLGGMGRGPRLDEKSIQVRFISAPAGRKGSPAAPAKTSQTPTRQTSPAAEKPKPAVTVPPPEPEKPAQLPKPELKPPEKKQEKTIPEKKEPEKKPPEPKQPEPKKTEAAKLNPEPKPPDKKTPEPENKKPEAEKPADDSPPAESLPRDVLDDIEMARSQRRGDTPGGGKGDGSDGDARWSDAMAGMEGDVRVQNYYYDAAKVLLESWFVPVSVPVNAGLQVDFIVRVDQEGNILDYEVIHPSNHAELDRSIKTLFERVTKVPPPPFKVEGGVIVIPYRFIPGETD